MPTMTSNAKAAPSPLFTSITPDEIMDICKRVVRKYVYDENRREDAVGECLLACCNRAEDINADDDPAGKVVAIAYWRIRTMYRKARTLNTCSEEMAGQHASPTAPLDDILDVRAFVGALTPRQRDILRKVLLEDEDARGTLTTAERVALCNVRRRLNTWMQN